MDAVVQHVQNFDIYTWLALIFGFLVLIYWQGLRRYNSILGGSPLPGPKPWPWIGNLVDIFKYGGIHKMLLNYFYKYGRVYKTCFGRTPIIVVTDPEIVKQIMVKDFWKFPNRPAFIQPNPPLNSGLFLARDGTWKRIRTTLTPTFTANKLKQIVPIIDDASHKLLAKMEKFSETGKHLHARIELRNEKYFRAENLVSNNCRWFCFRNILFRWLKVFENVYLLREQKIISL